MNIIYTAISNGYDTLKPHPPVTGCRFVAFVDNPKTCPDNGWELRKLIPFHSDPIRNSKRYKILAHKMLPRTTCSLWLDGRIEIMDGFDFDSMIEKFLARHDMALFNHPRRNCVYDEAETCQQRKLDDPSTIDKQMSRYRTEGYPERHGLTINGIILRRHTHQIALFNTRWWKEICEGSRRDQLSLSYSLWKTRTTYTPLPGNPVHNQFFKICWHHHPRHHFQSPP